MIKVETRQHTIDMIQFHILMYFFALVKYFDYKEDTFLSMEPI